MAALCHHVRQEHEPSHTGIQSITFGNMEEVHSYTLLTFLLRWMLHVKRFVF